MIILDTNVVSQAIKHSRDMSVIDWLDRQSAETLYLTAASLSELLTGVAMILDGKRKNEIESGLSTLITRLFGSRILPFDHEAAVAFSALISKARREGRSVSIADGQIGAIASVHKFSIATRDTAPFEALGIAVINPWNDL